MKAQSVRLLGPSQRQYAHGLIEQSPDGYVMKLGAETRRDAQNRRLWPMIDDVRQQIPGFEAFNKEDTKTRFMNALGIEMRYLPVLEGQGMFPVGLRSSTLTVAQFSGLLDLIGEFGGRNGVIWTDPR